MILHPVRQRLEDREEQLSPLAARSRLARRERAEEPCPVRTEFQRDRDRIIHCKAFRRLKHKTQVFIAPLGDHYVTRLTHTLEVAQIERTISRALNLNEDLTEAIALGHDLGHTPFGHVGEEVLNELYPQGFRHNEQSLRVVEFLEAEGQGLNLTREVREGILNHSKTGEDILAEGRGSVAMLEGQVCKLADVVAYINHDVDDAIRAGLIEVKDLPPMATAVLGQTRSQRINTLVSDIIDQSWEATAITMSPGVLEAANALRQFLFQRVYNVRAAREETEKAREVVRVLYEHFSRHPEQLVSDYTLTTDTAERRAVDYISGMTDGYAMRRAEELIPCQKRLTIDPVRFGG